MEGASNGERPKGKPRGRPFSPGTSGNPGGRPKDAESLAAQLREVLDELDDTEGKTGARLLAEAMLKLAIRGNVQAAVLIYDRLEGRPAQSVTLKGDDAAPLHVLHTDRMEGWEAPGTLSNGQDDRALPEPTSQ